MLANGKHASPSIWLKHWRQTLFSPRRLTRKCVFPKQRLCLGSDNNNSLSPGSKVSNHNIWFFATCKGIQVRLGFWIPRRGFRIPSTGFWILCQWNLDPRFQLLIGFWIPLAGFRIPEPRIPYFTSKSPQIPDSSSKKFPDSLRTRCKMLVRMIVKQIKPARPGPGYLCLIHYY